MPLSAPHEIQAFLLLLDEVRRITECEHVPGVPGIAGRLARAESRGRDDGRESRAGSELPDQYGIAVGAKELFLSRPA